MQDRAKKYKRYVVLICAAMLVCTLQNRHNTCAHESLESESVVAEVGCSGILGQTKDWSGQVYIRWKNDLEHCSSRYVAKDVTEHIR